MAKPDIKKNVPVYEFKIERKIAENLRQDHHLTRVIKVMMYKDGKMVENDGSLSKAFAVIYDTDDGCICPIKYYVHIPYYKIGKKGQFLRYRNIDEHENEIASEVAGDWLCKECSCANGRAIQIEDLVKYQ